MNKLEKYFLELLPGIDITPMVDAFSVQKHLKKGDQLVAPGQRASFLAFIHKGAFRVYYYDGKGNEVTTWFSFEGMFIADLPAYYNEEAANQHIEAIEESELYVVQKEQLEKLYQKHPAFQTFGRRFAERGMVKVMDRMRSLQTKPAEQRYLELLAQPQFMQKIPLKYLASYLGITDTSLSRIRKQIL